MTLDQQTAAFLDQLNQYDTRKDLALPIAEARAGANILFTGFTGEIEQRCKTADHKIAGVDYEVPVRLYYPAGHDPATPLPIVVFFHGGGWSLGDVESYDSLLRALCVASASLYVSVDYRLAPEHKFPTGLNDCQSVTEWVLDHGDEIGGDTSKVAVMGDSAGGNLAAAIAQDTTLRTRLKAQILLYPVLDMSRPHEDYPSRMTMGNGEYLLSRAGIDRATNWYLKNEADCACPDVSPMVQQDLSQLPPSLTVVGVHDPLRDEAIAYHDRLLKAGIDSRIEIYSTTIHAFLSLGILDVAHEGRNYVGTWIRQLFKI